MELLRKRLLILRLPINPGLSSSVMLFPSSLTCVASMGMSAGTSECPRLEQRTVLTDHVEEWKHEHELGHCIRQSHAKKSQQEHWDTQWVEYEHNISSFFKEIAGSPEEHVIESRSSTLALALTESSTLAPALMDSSGVRSQRRRQSQSQGFPDSRISALERRLL